MSRCEHACGFALQSTEPAAAGLHAYVAAEWVKYFVHPPLLKKNPILFSRRYEERFGFGLAARHLVQLGHLARAVTLFERAVAVEVVFLNGTWSLWWQLVYRRSNEATEPNLAWTREYEYVLKIRQLSVLRDKLYTLFREYSIEPVP